MNLSTAPPWARRLGKETNCTVTGSRADLILVEENPLEDLVFLEPESWFGESGSAGKNRMKCWPEWSINRQEIRASE
jgi:hypothetical protein